MRPRRSSGVVVRPLNFTVRGHGVNYGPLLEQTHQTWEVRAMMIGVSAAVLLEAVPLFFTFGKGAALLFSGLGAWMALISVVIAFVGIKCPGCGSHWMWRAAFQPSPNWVGWLRRQQVCPACKQLAVPSNNRWSGP